MKRNLFVAILALILAMPFASVARAGDGIFGFIDGNTFTFSSGVGAWSTEIVLSGDGSFIGHFYDPDMNDTGDDYPEGTRYECRFSGTFVVTETIDQYTYELCLAALNIESETGVEQIVDGVKVINTGAYGIEGGEIFMLYCLGRETADLPEEFLEWIRMPNAWEEVPDALPFYGLYNVEEGTGFFSYAQDEDVIQDGNSSPSDTLISLKEALSLVNGECEYAYVEGLYDSDIDSEFGLQIHGIHSYNFKLLCSGPELATDGQFYYQVQQYEIVIDDPETGEGHTATSNWYYVNAATGEVIPWFIRNGNENKVLENGMWLAIDFG